MMKKSKSCYLYSKKEQQIVIDDEFMLEYHVERQVKARGIGSKSKTTLLRTAQQKIMNITRDVNQVYLKNTPMYSHKLVEFSIENHSHERSIEKHPKTHCFSIKYVPQCMFTPCCKYRVKRSPLPINEN